MQAFDARHADYRARLLEGFAAALADKGYAATTIADVVRHARVSKRTFYEHFADKEACLFAMYEAATQQIRTSIRDAFAATADAGWVEQIEAAVDAYVTALETQPAVTQACLVEMLAAGPRAMKLRREVLSAFAALLREFVDQARVRHPALREISEPLAMAIVGGIDELLLTTVERGPQARLSDIRQTATDLVRAVVTRPAS